MMLHPVELYARQVVAGNIVAGPPVRGTCRRHLADLEAVATGKRPDWRFNVEAAQDVYDFFQEDLKLSEGQFEGTPFKLHLSQLFILGCLYGWQMLDEAGNWVRRFRRAYIEMGKGNGKSPMVGGMGLYGMLADDEPGAQIYSAGATRDQADILFQDAVKMAQQSETLWEDITPSGNAKILNLAAMNPPHNGSFFRPLSREKARTGSGPRPHMGLCDELHEHPDGGIIEMLERGFKFRRQPMLVMITNSGSDRKSVCWEEHQHAVAVALGEKEDDRLFSYVCALDETDQPLKDPSCWIKANPLLGVTITNEYLRGNVKQALDLPMKQNNILRLHFCVWTDAQTAWISRKLWEACEDPEISIEQFYGRKAWCGLDLSMTRDMTANAIIIEDGFKDVPDPQDETKMKRKGCYVLFVLAYTPKDTLELRAHRDKAPYEVWEREGHLIATPGPIIRLDYVAKDLIDISMNFDLQACAYDRYLVRTFSKELGDLGAAALDEICVEHPQGINRRQGSDLWMPGSIDSFEELLLEGRLRIGVNPVLRSAVASSTFWKSPAGLRRFDKSTAVARIDAAVASAMAVGIATLGEEQRISVYEIIGQRPDIAPKRPSGPQSVFDQIGKIDYAILDDPRHPQFDEMLQRYNRKADREDALEEM